MRVYFSSATWTMQAWGAVNYHNAVIFCRDDGGSESSDGDGGGNGVKVSTRTHTKEFN